MTTWRFDQGRLSYFLFDEIKRIARALTAIDGIGKPGVDADLLRDSLLEYSQLPFLPNNYTVWRNYKRVFGCLLLATDIGGKIICTDLCKQLANPESEIDIDDYMRHFATNFYYPSPVFEGYNCTDRQIFPIVTIIKFLLNSFLLSGKKSISVEEVCNYLITNNVTGFEPLDFYSRLKPNKFEGDPRQPRELIKFISQFSFLKWQSPNLYLEIASGAEAWQLVKLFSPQVKPRMLGAESEVLNLGAALQGSVLGDLTMRQTALIDTGFAEGGKIRVTHLRTERSAKLSELYFSNAVQPHICDMCSLNTNQRYPWAPHIIELHHLLPLSSSLRLEDSQSSIKDLVGICPTCHRATHKFYSQWLKKSGLSDFRNDEEARSVYAKAKQELVLS